MIFRARHGRLVRLSSDEISAALRFSYPYEFRSADEHFDDVPDVKVPGEMLQLAEHILDSKAAPSIRSQFRIVTRTPWWSSSARSRPSCRRARDAGQVAVPRTSST